MKFSLAIHLLYEAMRTPSDVSEALERVGYDIWLRRDMRAGEAGLIRDLYGNPVGSWKVTEE